MRYVQFSPVSYAVDYAVLPPTMYIGLGLVTLAIGST